MIVKVSGIEHFVGDIKARYLRDALMVSENPMQHHEAFGAQLDGAKILNLGIAAPDMRHGLVECWEADPRRLVADMVETTDGKISYCVWEVP